MATVGIGVVIGLRLMDVRRLARAGRGGPLLRRTLLTFGLAFCLAFRLALQT